MKVLHVIQRYFPAIGGSEVWCRNVCSFVAQKGVINKVATIRLYNIEEYNHAIPSGEHFLDLGAKDAEPNILIDRYPLWAFYQPKISAVIARFLLFTLRMRKLALFDVFSISPHSMRLYCNLFAEARAADVVHLHTLPYFHAFAGYAAARMAGKKVVITPHFHPGHPHYERKSMYRLLNACDAVISVSEYERGYLASKGVDERKIVVTGNAIVPSRVSGEDEFKSFVGEVNAKHGLSPSSKKILFVGRKELYKGIGILLRAAQELAESDPDGEYVVFLLGPATSEFNRSFASADTGALKLVDFGSTDERVKEMVIRMCDVLVLPSEFEAFGIVFLEAWEQGKPVIGSDRGAIPEVIKGAGLCFSYPDYRDLKNKISMVLSDPHLARALGQTGLEKVKNEYSLKTIGGKVLDTYQRLAGKKKILIVSHLFPPFGMGGAEVVAFEQVRKLIELGYDVKVFAGKIDPSQRRFSRSWERLGAVDVCRVNLHEIDFENYREINLEKKEVCALFKQMLFEFCPDVVHFHNIYPLSLQVVTEVSMMNIPSVMTLHDYWGICFKNTLITDKGPVCTRDGLECSDCLSNLGSQSLLKERNSVIMKCFNSLGRVISPSKFLLQRYIDCGLRASHAAVILNGIDCSRFSVRKTRSSRVRFAFIGTVRPHKAVGLLIRALALLSAEELSKITLTVIGAGDKVYFEYCRRLTYDLSLLKRVIFAGEVDNSKIPEVFRNTDVLVLPARWPENSPVVITEALASGTPVIASRQGGIPELIEEGITGFMYKGDDTQAMANCLRRFINDPSLRSRMSGACRERALRYDLGCQVKLVAGEYERLIARRCA